MGLDQQAIPPLLSAARSLALSGKALAIAEASGESGMQRRTRGVILYNLASSYVTQKRYADLMRKTGREEEARALERRAEQLR